MAGGGAITPVVATPATDYKFDKWTLIPATGAISISPPTGSASVNVTAVAKRKSDGKLQSEILHGDNWILRFRFCHDPRDSNGCNCD